MSPSVLSVQFYCVSDLEPAQRSMVRKWKVRFDQQVVLVPDALTMERFASTINTAPPAGGPIGVIVETNAVQPDGSHVFTGRFTTLSGGPTLEVSGSLTDGVYQMTIHADRVANLSSEPMGADHVADVHRLFGDEDGDRTVEPSDLTAFNAAYRSRRGMSNYKAWFDFDQDGDVDGADQTQFYRRNTQSV